MEVMTEAVHKMKPGPEKEELLMQLRVKDQMQKAFDTAENQFRPESLDPNLLAALFTSYEILKGIADRLLSLEIQMMELVFRSEDPALTTYQLDTTYRRKWNDLIVKYSPYIKQSMKLIPGPSDHSYYS